MTFKEKLIDWYGEDLIYKEMAISPYGDTGVFLVESGDNEFEIARTFTIGGSTEISIDEKFTANRPIEVASNVMKYMNKMEYVSL